MATRRPSSLDRVLGRLDQLDAVNLTNLVQRLARERGLFEDIFNVLQEGILVVDVEGVIAYANDAADQLIGLGGGKDLAGQTLWRLVPGLRPSLGAIMDDDVALPIVAREFELTYPEPRTVRLYMVPFRSDPKSGAERRFVVILKFGRVDPLALLRQVRAPESVFSRCATNVRVRHLYHDREEFTIVGDART